MSYYFPDLLSRGIVTYIIKGSIGIEEAKATSMIRSPNGKVFFENDEVLKEFNPFPFPAPPDGGGCPPPKPCPPCGGKSLTRGELLAKQRSAKNKRYASAELRKYRYQMNQRKLARLSLQ
jgi:hypothetical protein